MRKTISLTSIVLCFSAITAAAQNAALRWDFKPAPNASGIQGNQSDYLQTSTPFACMPSQKAIGPIKGYNFDEKKVKTIELPKSLKEVSGLTVTDDGRLLCHNDESGIIVEVDYRTGKEIKKFYLGKPMVVQDFEGIAARKDTIFLVTSAGNIYRFHEAANNEHANYQLFKTSLSSKNDVEGLTYDPETDCLLLACKGDGGAGLGKSKAVYAFSLKTYKLDQKPRFVLPIHDIVQRTDGKQFNPSAIDRHPKTGNFFILAFNGFAIVEIDRQGKILGVSDIKKKINRQPEGLAIAPDGTIVIANEGQGKAGRLAIYAPGS